MNRAWFAAPVLALALSGCATHATSVGSTAPPAADTAAAPLAPMDVHQRFIEDLCVALDAGDAPRAGRLTAAHNEVHPGALQEAYAGMASRCPHQLERVRRSFDSEPSSGETQLEYACRTDPSVPECNSWQ